MQLKKKLAQWMWFGGGLTVGWTALAMSQAAPQSLGVKSLRDDTAIYQNLSEIRVQRQAELKTEHEVSRLAAMELHYREALPIMKHQKRAGSRLASQKRPTRASQLARHPRLQHVVERVSNTRYLP